MKLYVAYVLLESGLGGKILGVRANETKAKMLCQVDFDLSRDDGEKVLEWDAYTDHGNIGIQSTTAEDKQYYVEEAELEVQSRESDIHGMDWRDRRIIQLMIDNGWLAQVVEEKAQMYEPLEQRVEQLTRYIDTLLKGQNMEQCTFKDVDGNDELWEVKK